MKIFPANSRIDAPCELLFAAVENSPSSILITDKQGVIEYVNPGFCKMSGYSKEECCGHTPRIFQSGNTSEETYRGLWGALQKGESWEGIVQNKRKNGELYWSEEVISAVELDGENISHFIAIQHDVTEKVRVDQELEQSRERFKGFTDAASDWYWEMDKDLSFSFFSDSVERYSGLKNEDMLGLRRKGLVKRPEDADKWVKHEKDLLERKIFKDFEYSYCRPDGKMMEFQISGKPTFAADGAFTGYLGVGRDVTQRKLLEEKLRQSQKMEAVGQIAGGVAHDFNNILTIISGNAELLSEKTEQSEKEVSKELKNIAYAADRGAALTSQILAFSRKQSLSPQRVNLNDLIEEMTGMIVSSMGSSIELEFDTKKGLWNSFLDYQQMTNIILNACINARDAMKGKGRIIIATDNVTIVHNEEISGVASGDYTLLSIEDSGEGISKENLAKIFDPFFTTKPVGEGTGLGLSMLAEFAQDSGGGVDIDSEFGKGTILKIYLPREKMN